MAAAHTETHMSPCATQIADCSPFGKADNGDCGWYDGSDPYNITAAIVPAGMRAAIVDSDAAYPGSCGRYASS